MLLRTIEEKEHEIVSLKIQIENRDTTKSSQTSTMKDKGKTIVQEDQAQHSTSILHCLSSNFKI